MTHGTSQVYQFKISLKGIKPMIWRRIQVPADFNFQQLHFAIQGAMGWHTTHLYMFRISRVEIGEPQAGEDIIPAGETKLPSFFPQEKARGMYEYDFGDGWEHNVVLEKILPKAAGEMYPKCIAGKRACPPEDCGGTEGYKNHVEIVSNQRHPEYDEHMEWLEECGHATDPEEFDLNSVHFQFV